MCPHKNYKKGTVAAAQLENAFKAQAGQNSTWKWYAKKLSDNIFQMRFPTAKKVEDLSFFTRMQMGTVPDVTFKVEQWNPNAGAKSKLESAWFRIFGIPLEKRSIKKISFVPSLVGLDTGNMKRWDFTRVKIGCRDITKVPGVVEGLLDFHFYDLIFQREVPSEGVANTAGTKWIRTTDGHDEDKPSPKKPKWNDGSSQQSGRGAEQSSSGVAGNRSTNTEKAADSNAGKVTMKKDASTEEAANNLQPHDSNSSQITNQQLFDY